MANLLHIEELPEGVRYVLPRRRRRGWLPLLRSAGCAFVLYGAVPVFLLGLIVQTGRVWIAPIALVVVLLFLVGGIVSLRSAWAILSAPDVELTLAPGRLEVRRHSLLGGATTVDVPLRAVRRFVIDSLYEPESAARPELGLANGMRRMLGSWFGRPEEQVRAEQRRAAVQRFFGALVLEGDDNAAVLLADGLSQRYLRRLADDLATRCAAAGQAVAVESSGIVPQPIPADDPRLQRPASGSAIEENSAGAGITITVPPLGFGRNELAILVVLTIVLAMFTFVFLPGLLDSGPVSAVGMPLVFLFFLIPFARMAYVTVGSVGVRLRRATLTVADGTLRVFHDDRLWQRERRWSADEVAAFTLEECPNAAAKQNGDQPDFVYDLVLLDHSQNRTILVRRRGEAELEWVVAVLHKELGLGL